MMGCGFCGFDTLGKRCIYVKEYKLYLTDEKLFHIIRIVNEEKITFLVSII